MKKKLLYFIITGILILCIAGCKTKETIKLNSSEINDYIINYLENHDDYENIVYNYVDKENDTVVVGLINNSKESQDQFIYDVFTSCCGSKTINAIKNQNIIKFEKSAPLRDLNK